MAKLYVPACGDRLQLTKKWTFKLHYEHRNVKLLDLFNFIKKTDTWRYLSGWEDKDGNRNKDWVNTNPLNWPVTLPKGTVLIVDRVYIRNGKGFSDYNSLTFRIESTTQKDIVKSKKKFRFWAKLDDVNNIMFVKADDDNTQ